MSWLASSPERRAEKTEFLSGGWLHSYQIRAEWRSATTTPRRRRRHMNHLKRIIDGYLCGRRLAGFCRRRHIFKPDIVTVFLSANRRSGLIFMSIGHECAMAAISFNLSATVCFLLFILDLRKPTKKTF